MVRVDGYWVGINTFLPNRLVREAIESGAIPELSGYASLRNEVPYGAHSRIDLLLERPAECCYVEVKNVTMVEGGVALFPDAVTLRGQKHLRDLMNVVRQGGRGVIFYVVQRRDGTVVAPADGIDPVYGRLLRLAVSSGVEALAYQASVTPMEICLVKRLPVCIDDPPVGL
jgi:sugar fermentation stimulation protein A